MSGITGPNFYQFRDFDTIYLFKLKETSDLSFKIFDLAHNCLVRQKFSSEETSSYRFKPLLEKGDFISVLEKVVSHYLLDKRYLILTPQSVTRQISAVPAGMLSNPFFSQIKRFPILNMKIPLREFYSLSIA